MSDIGDSDVQPRVLNENYLSIDKKQQLKALAQDKSFQFSHSNTH